MSRSQQFIIAREIPQFNYRTLPALNQSMLKLFDKDPVEFVKQFKLGQKRKERKGPSLVIGDIVDFYILDCEGNEEVFDHTHDEKFVLLTGDKGSGQAFYLADVLFEITNSCLDEDGKINCSFEQRFAEAFEKCQEAGKYKGKTSDKALEDFNDKAFDYFKTLMVNVGKTIVEPSLLVKAKNVAHMLLEDPHTKFVFQKKRGIEQIPKLVIVWKYKTKNGKEIECKSEIDLLEINHDAGIIFPWDVKTTYDNERFPISYLDFGYYLQAAFYRIAVKKWAEENGLGDFFVAPMQFVVGDTSSAMRRPLIYTLSEEDDKRGRKGFILDGKQYKGVEELIEAIEWAEETNNWNISKQAFDKKGILTLNLNYE